MARRIVLFLLDSDSEAARTEADVNSPRIAEARSNIRGSRGFWLKYTIILEADFWCFYILWLPQMYLVNLN